MRRLTGSRIANAIIIIAIIAVPLIYSGLFVWAYEDPMNRLERIDAAIVNLDQDATATTPTGEVKKFSVGTDLTANLTSPPAGRDVGFNWVKVATPAAGEEGLHTGKYRALLVIPEGFSAALAELAGPHPEAAQAAQLELKTDDGVNYLAGTMAQSVARELENVASTDGASDFIDSVLVSISTIHDGMSAAAAGAGRLAQGNLDLDAGAQALATGTGQVEDGTAQLATGAHRLGAGTAELAAATNTLHVGLRDLASGSVRLAAGNDQLAAGLGTLDAGAQSLAGGARELAGGVSQLGTGLGTYTAGVDQLDAGAAALLAGMTQPVDSATPSFTAALGQLAAALNPSPAAASGGQPTLRDGAGALNAGIGALSDGLGQAGQATAQLQDGADKLAAGAGQFAAGLDRVEAGARQLADGLNSAATDRLQEGAQAQVQTLKALAGLCAQAPTDPVCAQLDAGLRAQGVSGISGALAISQQVAGGIDQVAAATARAGAGASELATGASELARRAPALTAGANDLASGLKQLNATFQPGAGAGSAATPTLRSAVDQLRAGSEALNAGIARAGAAASGLNSAAQTRIVPGLEKLAGGAAQLAANSESVRDGATRAEAGAQKLATGAGTLADASPRLAQGAQEAAAGANELAAGAGAAASGAGRISAGAAAAEAGAGQLASGLDRALIGVNELNSGAQRLAAGTTAAASGAQTLASEITAGASEVPYFSDASARQVARVAANPIQVEAVRQHPAYHNGIGFAPFFLSLALYVGAIAMFFVFPSLDVRRSGWEKWWICAVRSFSITAILGIAQALAAVAGLELLLHLNAHDLAALCGVVTLASLCFVSINQACVAAFGYRGRFVSVLLLILQITSMGATFPIETAPSLLRFLSPLLPMTHLAEAIRTHIVGGGIPLSHGIWVIVAWMIGAWIVTLAAAKLRTGRKPMPFDPALAFPGTRAADATAKLSVASL